jgi:hypothetical protein
MAAVCLPQARFQQMQQCRLSNAIPSSARPGLTPSDPAAHIQEPN